MQVRKAGASNLPPLSPSIRTEVTQGNRIIPQDLQVHFLKRPNGAQEPSAFPNLMQSLHVETANLLLGNIFGVDRCHSRPTRNLLTFSRPSWETREFAPKLLNYWRLAAPASIICQVTSWCDCH